MVASEFSLVELQWISRYYHSFRLFCQSHFFHTKNPRLQCLTAEISVTYYVLVWVRTTWPNFSRFIQMLLSTARLLTRPYRSHLYIPILASLQWLPVRVEFKSLMIIYKACMGLAPEYISDLWNLYMPECSLRSSSRSVLVISKSRLKQPAVN